MMGCVGDEVGVLAGQGEREARGVIVGLDHCATPRGLLRQGRHAQDLVQVLPRQPQGVAQCEGFAQHAQHREERVVGDQFRRGARAQPTDMQH